MQEHSGEEANNPAPAVPTAPAMDETFHIGEEGLSSRTQEFISVTNSPSYTFEEEMNVLGDPQITEKLKKCMENNFFTPHNAKTYSKIKGDKAKEFPLIENIAGWRVKEHLYQFIFSKHFQSEFSAFKKADKEKFKRFFRAAMDGDASYPTEEFECNVIHLTYCPYHEKVPFFDKGCKTCSQCNRGIDSKNSLVMLSLRDLLVQVFSDPEVSSFLKNVRFLVLTLLIEQGVQVSIRYEREIPQNLSGDTS